MVPPLELDYIGMAEVSSSRDSSSDKVKGGEGASLRETELRLGLPGSESPERKGKLGLTLGLQPSKSFPTCAKRGFYDAIDGNAKWVFSGNGGSQAETEKGGGLFSPRAAVGCGGGHSASLRKDVSTKAAVPQETMTQEPPAAKAQVVGWPPIRSYRRNTMSSNPFKNKEEEDGKNGGCLYVKVSMDGAPFLRKVDLKIYCNYKELSSALEKMFCGFTVGQSHGTHNKDGIVESHLIDLLNGSEHVITYEDKDGDWMLVGDVPWEMFIDSCKRLRIMKGSDAIGLAPRAMAKNMNRS
ncbi:hypothetical protein HPP92_021312 [Vanilla planifolia]|uniref:Auxin-responsive protein n=1 Tax=Vanilla planifolia TaxID=51239 RepID=A0A835UKL4_VANPL|nr:hypothetical protein HPP92_021312 [Vanilla planifolia]